LLTEVTIAVRRIGVWLGVVIVLASVALGRAQTSKSEEYLLLGNANRGAGQPMVAVDPTNPNNIIAVAMGSVQQLHGKPSTQGSTNDYHEVANSTITWLAVTHDGGVTWDVKELPILSGKLTRCPDSFADVTKDGVFIAGCEPRETATDPDYWGMSALMVSTDKGRSWGPVVPFISDYELKRFAPGLQPVSGGFPHGAPNRVAINSPWDRPFTRIDDSTGVIYGVAQGGSAIVDAAAGRRRSQAYIGVRHDSISELNLRGLLPCCVRFAPTGHPVNGNTGYRPAGSLWPGGTRTRWIPLRGFTGSFQLLLFQAFPNAICG
jgi:hypothetical protein